MVEPLEAGKTANEAVAVKEAAREAVESQLRDQERRLQRLQQHYLEQQGGDRPPEVKRQKKERPSRYRAEPKERSGTPRRRRRRAEQEESPGRTEGLAKAPEKKEEKPEKRAMKRNERGQHGPKLWERSGTDSRRKLPPRRRESVKKQRTQ